MEKLVHTLNQINWNFPDYSSLKYPLDINSIPWYPATFPAPIPRFLISLLSDEGDVVLDPFGGKGTTAVEAIKLNRNFVYNDYNPFAGNIVDSIIASIKSCKHDNDVVKKIFDSDVVLKNENMRTCKANDYEGKDRENILSLCPSNIADILDELDIDRDVIYWYHIDTLLELISILKNTKNKNSNTEVSMIRKFAFVSVLKETSSQRGHFTYVTDNCRPKKIIYYDAISSYLSMLERIDQSSLELLKQYDATNSNQNILDLINHSIIHEGDARQMEWINNNSIDLIVTSPPYLCAQDYVKTMRLINLFFPIGNFKELASNEIGPRSQRRSNSEKVVNDFYSDMSRVFSEIARTLKPGKFFCLIIGQGKGKVTATYDTIADLTDMVISEHKFDEIYRVNRKIGYKAVQVGGVDTESIIIFQKK